MACAAFIIIGLSFIILRLCFIMFGSTPISLMRFSCSGPMFCICSIIWPISSADMSLTLSFTSAICSGVSACPTPGIPAPIPAPIPTGSAATASSSSSSMALALAADEFGSRASAMRSSSKRSTTSFHTRPNPARSTREAPFAPSSQHSRSSGGVMSDSSGPVTAAMGPRVANARKVTPPLGGCDMYSAERYIASIRAGSLASLAPAGMVVELWTASRSFMTRSTISGSEAAIVLAADSISSGLILAICCCAILLDATSSSGLIFSIIFCADCINAGLSRIIFIDACIMSGSIPMALSCSFCRSSMPATSPIIVSRSCGDISFMRSAVMAIVSGSIASSAMICLIFAAFSASSGESQTLPCVRENGRATGRSGANASTLPAASVPTRHASLNMVW
mmetsp:Transcript_12076/g.28078  ORF Transcript_12076/g.28078 Transcript_12076/m.28078 type:complete len:395 (+) Transcript_12076:1163-2347(+)